MTLDHALAAAGSRAADIDIVSPSHLHFDHAGGFTTRGGDGDRAPALPACPLLVRAGSGRMRRTRTSGTAPATSPRTTCRSRRPGVLTLVEDDGEIMPGVRRAPNGRPHRASPGRADRVGRADGRLHGRPDSDRRARAAARGSWATTSIRWTRWSSSARFCAEAVEREYLVFFEHDPVVRAGYLRAERRADHGGSRDRAG